MKLLIFLHLKTPTKKLLAYQPALNKMTLHEFCTWSLVVNLEPVKKSNNTLPGGSLQHLAYQSALYKMTLHEFCTWSLVVNLEPMKKIKPCPACWQSSGRTSGSIPDLVYFIYFIWLYFSERVFCVWLYFSESVFYIWLDFSGSVFCL